MKNTLFFTKVFNLEDSIKLYKEFQKMNKKDKLIFDFSNATFVYANFTALFGALIDSCDKFEIILPKDEKVKSVLSKNNFFPNFLKDVKKLRDKSNSVIHYENFGLKDIEKQYEFSKKLLLENLLEKKGVTNLSQKALKKKKKSILELFENARQHSKSDKGIYIAGQFFPKKGKFDFTIVDLGVGIRHNVNDFLKETKSGSDSIKWAIQRQNSTNKDNPRGLGLALLKELIMKSNGKIEILSDNGLYSLIHKEEIFKDLDFNFNGALINIEFNIEKDKKYFLKGETNHED